MRPATFPRPFILAASFVLTAALSGLPAFAQPDQVGRWAEPSPWPNVGIHLHVLPNGKVMFWGRREWNANGQPAGGLDPQDCTPRLWDPRTGQFANVPKPGFNLFCSGHAFLPDGRLFVAGGHIQDSRGVKHATIYNPATNTWQRQPDMNDGRWYPTVVPMPDGSMLVSSGDVAPDRPNNTLQQVWANGQWRDIVRHDDIPLYPRMHVAPDGRVFLAGHLVLTQLLTTAGNGGWERVGDLTGPQREDGCSVTYAPGKVLNVGGGLPGRNTAETIDLTQPAAQRRWRRTGDMAHARRHHNATILPDGTVLVTGGHSGPNFNDLNRPVFEAELWDPATGKWTRMAKEKVPRMYHSAAVLLPDGRVLSAGGGEYSPDFVNANDPRDSHRDAQIFSPPYLFRGDRPVITAAPDVVGYGQAFAVETPQAGQVAQVNWVRLSSVTHSCNFNQRFNSLKFTAGNGNGTVTVTAPPDRNVCPPGHYMLFVLNQNKVPSEAKIVRIG